MFLYLSPLKLDAQSPILINYNSDHGLPSSETYDLYQDKNGFIWITSDRGLSKFDGLNFNNYNTNNGLPSDVVFHFFPENDTTVWITTIKHQTYRFNPLAKELVFKPFFDNVKLEKIAMSHYGGAHIKRFKRISNAYYFSFQNYPGYLLIEKNKEPKISSPIQPNKELSSFSSVINLNRTFSFLSFVERIKDKVLLLKSATDNTTPITLIKTKPYSSYGTLFELVKIVQKAGQIEILIGDHFFVLDTSLKLKIDLESIGTDLIISPDKKIRIVTTHAGTYIFDNRFQLKHKLLKNAEASSALIDKNNGLWISTLKQGVYYIKNLEVNEILNQDKSIPSYKTFFSDHYTFITTGTTSLTIFDSINKVVYNSNKIRFSGNQNYALIPKDNMIGKVDFSNIAWEKQNEICFSLRKGKSNFVLINSKVVFNDSYFDTNKPYLQLNFKAHNIYQYSKNKALLVSEKGAYIVHQLDSITPYKHGLESATSQPIKFIDMLSNNFIFGTVSNGLFIEKDSFIVQINKASGLIDNKITDLLIQDDSTVWVSSYSGLSKIKFSNGCRFFKIENYTKDNFGLLSNEINDININKGKIWVCSKKGVFYFPTSASPLKNPITLTTDSIFVNAEKIISTQQSIALKYQDEFQLHYSLIKFTNKNYRTLVYSLDNKNWYPTSTKSLFIKFTNWGEQVLRIKDEESNQILLQLNISVKDPFWLRWPFFILVAVSIFILIFLIALFSIKYSSKKIQRKIDSAKLELKALSAQINPHFTFNTINSIQHFLIKNDKKGGIRYLSEYANLIRQSLYLSRKGHTALIEEIEFIELYCALERKRFEHDFKFNVINNSNMDLRTIITPSLLLQPVIENAIIHGLNHEHKNGEITLTITNQSDSVDISITDNGSGVLNAKKIKEKSLGLKILNERLALFNRTNKSVNQIHIGYLNSQTKKGSSIQFKIKKQN